jgi:hypothetical protein
MSLIKLSIMAKKSSRKSNRKSRAKKPTLRMTDAGYARVHSLTSAQKHLIHEVAGALKSKSTTTRRIRKCLSKRKKTGKMSDWTRYVKAHYKDADVQRLPADERLAGLSEKYHKQFA